MKNARQQSVKHPLENTNACLQMGSGLKFLGIIDSKRIGQNAKEKKK
jgi:hypothetical protein